MLLTVDISNSHITLGLWKEKDGCLQENLSFMARLVTETQRTDDQYAVELQQILRLYHVIPHQIDDVILARWCRISTPRFAKRSKKQQEEFLS